MNNLPTPLIVILIILSLIFVFALSRAVISVLKDMRIQRKREKQSKKIQSEQAELKKKGFKPFKFNGGKTTIYAKNFKEANAQNIARTKELSQKKR